MIVPYAVGTWQPSHNPMSDLNHPKFTLPRARHPSLLDQLLKLPPFSLGEAAGLAAAELADITLHVLIQQVHSLVRAWSRHLPDPLVR